MAIKPYRPAFAPGEPDYSSVGPDEIALPSDPVLLEPAVIGRNVIIHSGPRPDVSDPNALVVSADAHREELLGAQTLLRDKHKAEERESKAERAKKPKIKKDKLVKPGKPVKD